jgi:hypothetical protein
MANKVIIDVEVLQRNFVKFDLTTMVLLLLLLGEGAFLRTVLTTNITCAKERSLAQ